MGLGRAARTAGGPPLFLFSPRLPKQGELRLCKLIAPLGRALSIPSSRDGAPGRAALARLRAGAWMDGNSCAVLVDQRCAVTLPSATFWLWRCLPRS